MEPKIGGDIVLDEAAIASVRGEVIAKLRRTWLRATWACAAVTVGATTWETARGVTAWWLGVPLCGFLLCWFYLVWAYHARRPMPSVEDMRSDLERRGRDRPSRGLWSVFSRLGLLAIAAVAWPTAAGSVIGLWAIFAGVFAIWLRLT